jgi:hypothetical protein
VRHPNADRVKKLTQKLQEQNDVSPKEADSIYWLLSLYSRIAKLGPKPSKEELALEQALSEWYNTVAQKIKQGYRGNFLFTMLFPHGLLEGPIHKARNKAEDYLSIRGHTKDVLNGLTVNSALYHSFPKWLQKLFVEITIGRVDPGCEVCYNMQFLRAGMLYYPIKTDEGTKTIAQFLKQRSFSPVIKTHGSGLVFWEIASGVRSVSLYSWNDMEYEGLTAKTKPSHYVVAAYLRQKNVPLILAGDFFYRCSVFFTEKDKFQLIKDALEVPFEDIVSDALYNNAIDTKTANDLLNHVSTGTFSPEKFVEAGVKYIDRIVQEKAEWRAMRETVKKDWQELEER